MIAREIGQFQVTRIVKDAGSHSVKSLPAVPGSALGRNENAGGGYRMCQAPLYEIAKEQPAPLG